LGVARTASAVAIVLAAAGCGRPELEITNALGSYDICDIYVYADSSARRGPDLLDGRLQPGETWATELAIGGYDIIIVDEDGDTYSYEGIPVDGNGHLLRVMLDDLNMGHIHRGDGSIAVTIENGLPGTSIYFAYAAQIHDQWGADLLGSTVMLPGEKLTVWVLPGTWHLKLVDQYGTEYVREDLEIGPDGYGWQVGGADVAY
jgi:hypothetical protein